MSLTRRRLLGTALATLVLPAAHQTMVGAQHATPEPVGISTPGSEDIDAPRFGIARVRTHPTPERAQAVYPDVMSHFLPATAAVPGYFGYIFAFGTDDPRSTINITLLDHEAAAADAQAVAEAYVEGMDPRLSPETPIAEQGGVRIYQLTERPRSELPPLLHDCHITMRHRRNAPDTDIEGIIRSASEGFGPIQGAMEGFILYCWMHAADGRISFNIWETAEHMQAGNEAVAAWGAANPVITSEGETVVLNGVIGYSDILGRS
jgi:hypothetical protein